jgi:hypothetical protein
MAAGIICVDDFDVRSVLGFPLLSLSVPRRARGNGISDAHADDVTRDDRSLVHVCPAAYARSHSIRDRFDLRTRLMDQRAQ